MNGPDVFEGAWRCEGHPKSRSTDGFGCCGGTDVALDGAAHCTARSSSCGATTSRILVCELLGKWERGRRQPPVSLFRGFTLASELLAAVELLLPDR